MVDSPSLVLAFAAGFVSFVSPCCLRLVPGYLAVIGGSGSPLWTRGDGATHWAETGRPAVPGSITADCVRRGTER